MTDATERDNPIRGGIILGIIEWGSDAIREPAVLVAYDPLDGGVDDLAVLLVKELHDSLGDDLGDSDCEDFLDSDPYPATEPITDTERGELARLEEEFAEAGGRGVDVADRIDELRRKAEFSPRACRSWLIEMREAMTVPWIELYHFIPEARDATTTNLPHDDTMKDGIQ